jgi:hypothetical protein
MSQFSLAQVLHILLYARFRFSLALWSLRRGLDFGKVGSKMKQKKPINWKESVYCYYSIETGCSKTNMHFHNAIHFLHSHIKL